MAGVVRFGFGVDYSLGIAGVEPFDVQIAVAAVEPRVQNLERRG